MQRVEEYEETDSVFDLIGDFDSNGTVDDVDFEHWWQVFSDADNDYDPAVDADDNGVIDMADNDEWTTNEANELDLVNVFAM